MSELLAFSGDTGAGKTRSIFSIIEAVLRDTDKKVHYIALDRGHQRFLKRPTIAPHLGTRLFIYNVRDFIALRDTYRAVKQVLEFGDWLVIERVDLAWDWVQDYVGASVNQMDEDNLDQMFLEKRIKQKIEKGREALKTVTQNDYNPLDWSLIRSNYNGIVKDAYDGDNSTVKDINVIMTFWALPSGDQYDTGGDDDPRDLSKEYGMVIKGEKKTIGYAETHLLFRQFRGNYVFDTIKDRERGKGVKQVVAEDASFLDVYQGIVQEDIINAT